jgi:hypothetical protein
MFLPLNPEHQSRAAFYFSPEGLAFRRWFPPVDL